MTRISIREFNKNITKWLNCGKKLIITKNSEDLVVITPVATPVATPKEDNVATSKPNVITKEEKAITKGGGKLPSP